MRPKKSPAPGVRRSSSASATVTSTYSLVISSAAPSGFTRENRSIIRSRHAREYRRWACSAGSSGNTSALIGVRHASLPRMENEQVEAEQVEIEEELLVEEISIDGMCGVY